MAESAETQNSPEEELEERTLRGVYPNKMLPAMRRVARRIEASFQILAREGEEYTVPESQEPLRVRANNTYIEIVGKRPKDFETFWDRVDKIHESEGLNPRTGEILEKPLGT